MTELIEATGLLVFYVNIGTMPPYNAEAFVERFEDHFKNKALKDHKLPDNVVMLFVPVRPPQETRLEYIPMIGVDPALVRQLSEINDKTIQFWSEHKAEDFEGSEEVPCQYSPRKSWWKNWFGW